MTTELLEEFARDESAWKTFKPNGGVSFASTAKTEIPTVEEGFAKFPSYMFPHADEQRSRLLAAVNVYVFVLDDSWETYDEDAVGRIQNDFVSRLLPQNGCQDGSKSSLQTLIDSTIQGSHDQDRIAGNGGQQVVDRMVDYISHSPPKQSFQTLDQYLEYRRNDIAMPYVFACAKFSIESSVDIDSPKFARFEYLVSNQVSINNDVASWKKEKLSYDSGKTSYLINTVDVVGRLMGLHEDAAITMSYALQLEVERQIDAELEHWMVAGTLDEEEWQFADAALLAMTGNVICSSILRRYGGEPTRL